MSQWARPPTADVGWGHGLKCTLSGCVAYTRPEVRFIFCTDLHLRDIPEDRPVGILEDNRAVPPQTPLPRTPFPGSRCWVIGHPLRSVSDNLTITAICTEKQTLTPTSVRRQCWGGWNKAAKSWPEVGNKLTDNRMANCSRLVSINFMGVNEAGYGELGGG